jgi:hypothetical protein
VTDSLDDPSLDLDSLVHRNIRTAAPNPLGESSGPQDQPEHSFFNWKDTALAVPRGLADAAHGLYSLADTVAGDALPDWEKNPFGESTSTVGSLLEGATNFAVGFVPIAGVLGKVGEAAEGVGLLAKLANPLVRTAVASGATGFALFGGHERRLSNLIQSVPALQNPITDFLQAKEDDPEIVGRLKNAVEQAGMGVAFDALFLGLKSLRAGRKVLEAGGTEAEANTAAQAAAPREELSAALKHVDEAQAGASPPQEGAPPDQPGKPSANGAAATPPSPTDLPDKQEPILKALGVDDVKIKEIAQRQAELKQSTVAQPGMLGGEEVGQGETLAQNPRTMSASESLARSIKPGDMNLAHFDSPEGALAYLRANEQLFRTAAVEDIKALSPQTIESMKTRALKSLSDMTGADDPVRFYEQMTRGISGDLQATPELFARLNGYLFGLEGVARQGAAQMDRVFAIETGAAAGNIDEEILKSVSMLNQNAQIQMGTKGILAEVGRGFRSLQMMHGGAEIPDILKGDPARIAEQLQEAGGRDYILSLLRKARMAYGTGDAAGISRMNKLLRPTTYQTVKKIGFAWWMNALLGSPKTLVVNTLGQGMTTIYQPFEQMMGGAILKGVGGARGSLEMSLAGDQALREAGQRFLELKHGLGEMMDLVKQSFEGKEIGLRARNEVVDAVDRQSVSAADFGLDKETPSGRMVQYLANLVQLPSKVLGETDKVIKQLNFRAYARSRLMTEAQDLVAKGTLTRQEIPQYVTSKMDQVLLGNQVATANGVYARGRALAASEGVTDPALQHLRAVDYVKTNFPEDSRQLAQESLGYGDEVSFTKPAEKGSWSWSIQQFRNEHPLMKVVLPFVNTPINLLKWSGQRLDAPGVMNYMLKREYPAYAQALGATKDRFALDMAAGGVKQAQALGRIMTGIGITTTMFSAAASGFLTGHGPVDKQTRDALLASGWLPYSFHLPGSDSYIQYARLDPFATMFGLVADTYDTAKHSMAEDQDGLSSVVHGLAIASAFNLTNKSYLAGLKNALDALSDPDNKIPTYVRTLTASLVPGYLNAATGPVGDDNLRDVRSILDAVKARIPGLSDNLPPQRNMLGEPVDKVRAAGSDISRWADFVNPIAYRTTSDDVVNRELGSLAYPFSLPRRIVNGLDLSEVPTGDTTAYDRWGELRGTVAIGGLALKDALRRKIMSPEYQRLEAGVDLETGNLSPRAEVLNGIMREYSARAWQQLLRENPQLEQHDVAFHANKQRLRHGLTPIGVPTVASR